MTPDTRFYPYRLHQVPFLGKVPCPAVPAFSGRTGRYLLPLLIDAADTDFDAFFDCDIIHKKLYINIFLTGSWHIKWRNDIQNIFRTCASMDFGGFAAFVSR
jgi:hypothetical protein